MPAGCVPRCVPRRLKPGDLQGRLRPARPILLIALAGGRHFRVDLQGVLLAGDRDRLGAGDVVSAALSWERGLAERPVEVHGDGPEGELLVLRVEHALEPLERLREPGDEPLVGRLLCGLPTLPEALGPGAATLRSVLYGALVRVGAAFQ